MAKDYYKILGVNKTDSTETIKKAYRDAVKRLHPDVNKGSFDKKRFYDIQEAYETLGDEEKRKEYDKASKRGSMQGFVKQGGGYSREGYPWMTSPFEDLFAWIDQWSPLARRGRGGMREVSHRVSLRLNRNEARNGGEIDLKVPVEEPCPLCEGSGEVGLFTCPVCNGTGGRVDYFPVRVRIPAMVEDETVLRVPFAGPDGRRHLLIVFIEIDWFEE